MACLSKPAACAGCPLDTKGEGYVPGEGPIGSPIAFVAEAAGKVEALTGRPLVGDAGGMFTRLLNLLGWQRDAYRIDNAIRCFPGDTLVEASGIRRGYRRWYVGDLVAVQTREGILSGTPNHPVLTQRGWVAMDELQTGDYLVRGTLHQRMLGGDPHVEHMPAPFAKTFRTLAAFGSCGGVVGSDVDFHGDGRESQVDVVTLRHHLGHGRVAAGRQPESESDFAPANRPTTTLTTLSQQTTLLLDTPTRQFNSACRVVGGSYESPTLNVVHLKPAIPQGVTLISHRNAGCTECEAESRVADSGFLRQGFQSLPIPVALSEIVEIKRTRFAGHVFNLQTTSEEYIANGFIVHNCHPPNDWFDERAPWYYGALNHCQYVEETLAGGSKVVVTLGGTALKRVMGLVGHKKIQVKDFHGTINRDPTDRFWVVPTFHPSFLQRGAHNLIGTVLWDLQQAEIASLVGKKPDPGTIICDPPIDWFRAWVDQVVAARQQDPAAYPISSDVETPDKAGGKDEGEITADDRSFQILRVNISCHPDEGITVPFVGPYIDELTRLHQSPGPLWQWNREYDHQRLVAANVLREEDSVRNVDLMWLWHLLQSDLPRGLGFVAPFYSGWGPWKHLSSGDPVRYAAIDALQNHRIGFGLIADLHKLGMYDIAMRHTHQLHTAVLRPAQLLGVKIDRQRLTIFKENLIGKARKALSEIDACVPEAIAPLTPKAGLTRKPLANILHTKASTFTRKGVLKAGKPSSEIKQELYARARLIEKLLLKEVLVCQSCGAVDVQRRHRCKPQAPTAPAEVRGAGQRVPHVELGVATVTRWFWQEPFNPDSPKQVLDYILYKKHLAGKHKKTRKDTTDRETLERLERTTKDPFYRGLLDYRAINKVKGTYVEGTERRLDEQDRLHPQPTFKPSTMRLSYQNPNITNVVADKGDTKEKKGLASGFRACVVAGDERPAWLDAKRLEVWCGKYGVRQDCHPSIFACKLLEIDFSAIEAVLTGWFAGDPEYMRLAKLGVHAGLSSHVLGRPYDAAWPDQQLADYFGEIKTNHPEVYEPAKRFIHGRAYGLTRHGMMRQFPTLFPTEGVAKRYELIFEKMAPKIPAWQVATQRLAHRQHYLGGESHPFKYKHWFWSVYTYRRLNATQYYKILAKCRQENVESPTLEMNGQYFRMAEGEDAKRALALYPQGTASGVLKEALLRLLADPDHPSYIGDAYFGRTPFRAPIHDSGLFEIPLVLWDRIVPIIAKEFQRPVPELPLDPAWGLGDYLSIGVAAKGGFDWEAMDKVKVDGFATIEAAAGEPMELEDEDDWEDLKREVS